MNDHKLFYLPYDSLYKYIVQRNHVEWERYKPANEYDNAIKDLKTHLNDMNNTFRKVKNEVKTNNLKNYFKYNSKYDFNFIKNDLNVKTLDYQNQYYRYSMNDIEKEEKIFKDIEIIFDEIIAYFKKYEGQISRVSFR